MATVICPTCGEWLALDDTYRDWTVRCPHCAREFVADEDQSATDEDEPEDEDEDDISATDEQREAAREAALPVVAAPAIWLELCGWGGAICGGILGIVLIILGMEQLNNPPPNANANADPLFFLYMGCCLGVFGVPYSVVMALGARHMRHIESRGWAMTGAILGVASFLMFGVFGAVQAGIGTWALLTLDKPIVRRAFGLPPRHRPRVREGRD